MNNSNQGQISDTTKQENIGDLYQAFVVVGERYTDNHSFLTGAIEYILQYLPALIIIFICMLTGKEIASIETELLEAFYLIALVDEAVLISIDMSARKSSALFYCMFIAMIFAWVFYTVLKLEELSIGIIGFRICVIIYCLFDVVIKFKKLRDNK